MGLLLSCELEKRGHLMWFADHHCPWLASKCIVRVHPSTEPVKKLTDVQGHRTYPAFIHFLTCITLLSLYIGVVSGMALIYAFNNPFAVVGHVVSSELHYWLHCSERGHTVPWSSSGVCRYCIQSRCWFLLELSLLPHLVGFHLIFPCVY